jgi:saccharopepsin
MGNPYVEMLSLNPDEALVEFHDVRDGTPQSNITSDDGCRSTTVMLSTDVVTTIDKHSRYLPAMLAATALLIILAIVGLVLLCKRNKKGSRARKTWETELILMNVTSTRYPDLASPQEPHTYEPVSMVLTEDTLLFRLPPSRGSRDLKRIYHSLT